MSRILFVSDRRPAPGHGAGERTLSIYNALRKIAEVDLLLIARPGSRIEPEANEHVIHMLEDPALATTWYWRRRAYLLADFRVDRRIRDFVGHLHRARPYDAFFGRYHFPFMAGCSQFGPSFVDIDDMPADTWSSRIPGFAAIRRKAFLRAVRDFKTVFVTKKADADRIQHPDVRILPCISTQPEQTGPLHAISSSQRMLFVGGAGWPPNRQGIVRFIERCLPSIREKVPGAVLRVVGTQGSLVAGPDGVLAADFVPDLLAEYQQASVVICPIRTGSGAIVKLAEAVAYGMPVVATPFAAKGYDGILTPGEDFLVADSDSEFADSCVRLLVDSQMRNRLSAHALRTAAGKLDQSAIDASIRSAIVPRM